MQSADALPTIAEIAVTIAGFTGVLGAIRASSLGGERADLTHRIAVMLLNPSIVLLCALLPSALVDFSNSPVVIWGVPLCLYAALSGALMVNSMARVIRGSMRLTMGVFAYVSIAGSVVLQLLAWMSGLGLVLPYSPGVLVLCLIWTLLSAGLVLVSAVVVESGRPAE